MRELRRRIATAGAVRARCLGLLLFVVAGLMPAAAAQPPAAELSLRNLSGEPVAVRLEHLDSARAERRVLRPGELVRLPSPMAIDLSFDVGERRHEYRLDPGAFYTFRYDHNDEVDLFLGSHSRADAPDLAPFVPTPQFVVERMLSLAGVGPGDVLYDLGCGDGRIVVEAAKRHGTRGVGVDIVPQRITESKQLAAREGVTALVEFRVEDAALTDFSSATVLALYLLPESNALLRPSMERRLAPGARVVSHNYEIPGWDPAVEETLHDPAGRAHYLFLYVVAGPAAGAR